MHFMNKYHTVIKRMITWSILGALFWISFMYLPYWVFSIVLCMIMLSIALFEWQRLFDIKSLSFWLVLPFYPVLPFLLLMYMNNVTHYRGLLFILFMMVFAHDTGAYIAGLFFGNYKIAPHISPGKTWEGFLGGCLAACAGFWLALWELGRYKPASFIVIVACGVSILSLLGDLFESWLKRRAQVKDSGDILPGHGGFLDRFDGILFTAFFFYFFRDRLVCLLL